MPEWFDSRAMRLLYLVWLNVPPLRGVADRLMRWRFDAYAPNWTGRNPNPGRLDPLFAAIDRIGGHPSRVADLGCGTGEATNWLAERFPDAWTFGIDISPEMIEHAVSQAAELGSAARYDVGQVQATPFGDGEIDLTTLVNVPPPFREISRILAPGGHAVVVYTRGPETWFYSSPDRLRKGFASAGLRELDCGSRGEGEFFIAIKR